MAAPLPATMKAVVYDTYGTGTPEEACRVLSLRDVPLPTVGAGQLLLRVHAASVNAWDWDLLRGEPFINRVPTGLWHPMYPVLGCDVAGVVVATGGEGDSVGGFAVGDAVYGDLSGGAWGGFAEYVAVQRPEACLAKKPDQLSFEEAASVPQGGSLAVQGLQHHLARQAPAAEGVATSLSGERVLVNGAGGGSGLLLLQLLKRVYGAAEVTGVDSAEKAEAMKEAGADVVLDYRKDDFAAAASAGGAGYDFIYDAVGTRSASQHLKCLTPTGTYAMVGGPLGNVAAHAARGVFGRWRQGKGGQQLGVVLHEPKPADWVFLEELRVNGRVRPVIDKVYSLERLPEAMAAFGRGEVKGKFVIKIV